MLNAEAETAMLILDMKKRIKYAERKKTGNLKKQPGIPCF